MTQISQPPAGGQDSRRTLLARLLADRATAAAAGAAGLEAPLSFSQHRLWFFDQLVPGTAAYNIPVGLTLAGPLDPAILEQTLGEVLRRHDVLRATVVVREGVPFQRIGPWSGFPLERIDVTGAGDAAAAEAAAQAAAGEDARRPFDLQRGPLFRARLIRFGPDAHLLAVVFHHLVMDGWSTRVFAREVAAIYGALAVGRSAALPPLPIQYADFARTQREAAAGDAMAAHLAYWKQQLAGAPDVTELPTDFPRQGEQTFRGAAATVVLSAAASSDLKAVSRRHGVTLFMTALAAWKLLVSRLTGQTDLVIGSPIAGRTHPDVEGLIGCFVNALPLRTDLSDQPAFAVLLHRVRDACLAAYAHQELPFEKLVEELHPRRDLARPPLFQLVCNMLVPDAAAIEAAGIEIGVILPEEESTKFDVTLYVLDGEQIVIRLAYNADLFEPRRMQALLAQFRLLLAQVAADPSRRTIDYSLLTGDDVVALPDPRAPLHDETAGAPVHTAFLEQARSRPGRTAIEFGDRVVTYGDLDVRSRLIAERLQRAGFGAEQVAAVYARRSPGLVAAMLGVLRAGGAFALIDPSHPAARSVKALDALRPTAWIAIDGPDPIAAGLAQRVSALSAAARITVGEDGTLSGSADDATVAGARVDAVSPELARQLAYVAFTSGSTGEPKMILGEHGPLAHFIAWHTRAFALTADDRYTMLSGLAHDPLLRDVFAPLCSGATLCIPPYDRTDWAERLPAWLAATSATVAHLTPSLLRLLAAPAAAERPLSALRYAFFGGEPLLGRDVAALQRMAPAAQCVNFYGTTETPQAMGFFRVDPVRAAAPANAARAVPVGRGIDGVQLLVLNAGGGLAGPGERGEIYVRTRHLARGYAGADPDGRFATNPFTGAAGDRMYRTGDIGRYDAAGDVELLGRADFQVKVRGHRVELAEIETFLRAQPGVDDAIVVARQDDATDCRLVAYVRAAPGAPASDALRQAAREKLPEYMVPSSFVTMAAFPLTPNGKVDRAALPAPDGAALRPAAEIEAPRTPLEQQIADIWTGLLACGRVGVHDSFFDLGGHSLLATQLVSRLRAALDVDLPVRALFEAPTGAGMARRVDMLQWTAAAAAQPLAHGVRELEL